eukprot:5879158-Amphidinium_carterae.1
MPNLQKYFYCNRSKSSEVVQSSSTITESVELQLPLTIYKKRGMTQIALQLPFSSFGHYKLTCNHFSRKGI